MITRALLLLMLLPLAMLGCTPMIKNPVYSDCVTRCMEKKNKCMVHATTADEISRCDDEQKLCMGKCSAIPSMIPAEK